MSNKKTLNKYVDIALNGMYKGKPRKSIVLNNSHKSIIGASAMWILGSLVHLPQFLFKLITYISNDTVAYGVCALVFVMSIGMFMGMFRILEEVGKQQ